MALNPKKRKPFDPKARAICDPDLRHLVEPEHHGERLTLDVETGEYEIDSDDLTGSLRMLETHSPENLFTFRIGYPALGAFAGWGNLMP